MGIPLNKVEDDPEGLEEILDGLKKFADEKKDVYGIETVRVSLPPFNADTHLNTSDFFRRPETVLDYLDELAGSGLLDFYTAHSGLIGDGRITATVRKLVAAIPGLLTAHEPMFSSVECARNGTVSLDAIVMSAAVIKELAEADALMNLKFAATFNVPPNAPFFPSSYFGGSSPVLTVAVEGADAIVKAAELTAGLYGKKDRDIYNFFIKSAAEEMERFYERIGEETKRLCNELGIKFGGIDFTPAPYPEEKRSIGKAIEVLTDNNFGKEGTLFVSSLITAAIGKIGGGAGNGIGFSGLMLPVLEDSIIAERTSSGNVTVDRLLLFSSVCGTGPDCVPLPGDISVGELATILLDTAGLSVSLGKPLTARLMPIKGKKAGEKTDFNFEYFANGHILDIPCGCALPVFNNIKDPFSTDLGVVNRPPYRRPNIP